MLKVCEDLFKSWNDTDIKYCHWKSNEHLLEGLMGLTDLDVYVCYDDMVHAQKQLEKCGYIKFKPQKGARYPLVDEWIGFDDKTGKLIHIHLHYQIITGTKYNKEYVFPLNELIIESRILDENYPVYIVCPELELIILYSRIVLKASDKRCITVNKDYQKEIAYLKERVDLQGVQKYCKIFFADCFDLVYGLICKDELTASEFEQLYKAVKMWLDPYKKFSSIKAKIRYRYFRLRNLKNAVLQKYFRQHNICRKTVPHKGLAFCFLGADGSGKSTISIDVCKWLNWKIEASRFYLGSGDHYNDLLKKFLSMVSSRVSKSKVKVNQKDESSGDAEKASVSPKVKESFLKKILKIGFSTLQSIYLKRIAVRSYRELKKAHKYIAKGGIAIFDRFPQNQVRGLYDGPKIAQRYPNSKNLIIRFNQKSEERAILKAQKYQPDIMFKLLLPPEESVRRKPDHTIEEIRPKAEITKKLIFENAMVYEIDATQSYDDELLEIKRLIWRAISSNGNRI